MAQHLTRRAAFGSLAKNKNLTPRQKKPKTPKEKRMDDPENSKEHQALIIQLPCCLPGCKSTKLVDPHHLLSAGGRGAALRAKDRFLVPLCHEHHFYGVHLPSVGTAGELAWFADNGISEPIALANGLWAVRGDLEKMMLVLMAHWSESDER